VLRRAWRPRRQKRPPFFVPETEANRARLARACRDGESRGPRSRSPRLCRDEVAVGQEGRARQRVRDKGAGLRAPGARTRHAFAWPMHQKERVYSLYCHLTQAKGTTGGHFLGRNRRRFALTAPFLSLQDPLKMPRLFFFLP
jgi:hypothetical protein